MWDTVCIWSWAVGLVALSVKKNFMMLSLVNRYYMKQELNSFISSDESKPTKKNWPWEESVFFFY